MHAVVAVLRRRPVGGFFVLAYALSWGLGAALNGTPVAPNANFVAGVPLAALAVAALTDGRRGVLDLGGGSCAGASGGAGTRSSSPCRSSS